ncbi:hypothetical protein ACFXTH_012532 [Malus domestica]
MELDGKHGVEEARRGDEEHGEKRDELKGGQVYARSLGLEVDEGTRADPPFFFFLKALWSSVLRVNTGGLPTIVTPIGHGAFPIASLMYWSIAAR